jgi:hypothetical protein
MVIQHDAASFLLSSFRYDKEAFECLLASYWGAKIQDILGEHLDTVVMEETVPRVLRDDADPFSCLVKRKAETVYPDFSKIDGLETPEGRY